MPASVRAENGEGVAAGGAAKLSVLLLGLHAALFVASCGVVTLAGPSLNDCAYRECGDASWVDRAMWLHGSVGAIVLLADVVITCRRLTASRSARLVPSFGCVFQLVLLFVSLYLITRAGPNYGPYVNPLFG